MSGKLKTRLDQLMVDQGLAPDLKSAAALVMAGKVLVEREKRSPTPGMLIRLEAHGDVKIIPSQRFVSRGGWKLHKALGLFDVDVDGAVCLDLGASTGGFTDCLLQAGARRVYALDTGRGQLHYKLRNDDRVVNMERRNLSDGIGLPENIDVLVADVSFNSLANVLPAALKQLVDGGLAIVLLKPQFEAKKSEVPRGGVISDPVTHAKVIGRFVKWATNMKIRVRNFTTSGIRGDKGNIEFLLQLELPHLRIQ